MKQINIILLLCFSFMTFSCTEEVAYEGDEQVNQNIPIIIRSTIDNEDAFTKVGYGTTSYREGITFALKDQIGVYTTRSRRDSESGTTSDVFASYAAVGYIQTDSARNIWGRAREDAEVHIPLFPSTRLDMYAYYPWPDIAQLNAGTNTIVNTNDIKNVHFRIYQDQTTANLNLCNIMRAVPVRNKSYTTTDKTVSFTFKHILSLLEFYIYKDTTTYYIDNTSDVDLVHTWQEGDSLLLKRVVVMGTKVSTEGFFDLTGDDPNVRITENATSANESIYKRDSEPGTALQRLDAYTGATKGVRRHVILPPVPFIPTDKEILPDPQPGDQSWVEILVELTWKPAGATSFEYTNRRAIVRGIEFKSGKKYFIKIPIQRKTVDNRGKLTIEESVGAWNTVAWKTSFN